MKSKLLLAINMDCVSINADENFNPDDNPLMNEIEDDTNYNDEGGEEEEWWKWSDKTIHNFFKF